MKTLLLPCHRYKLYLQQNNTVKALPVWWGFFVGFSLHFFKNFFKENPTFASDISNHKSGIIPYQGNPLYPDYMNNYNPKALVLATPISQKQAGLMLLAMGAILLLTAK
ncbi:hypothetical protein CGC54_10150 [Capnocytophaga canimorsus]|uniref:Uncharacterized protein n=1 Tax=Capnocytophaga canimorsus TaxID=28188 RepID=A0AAC9Z5L3_9FLAO|nr:hypothetical protein [Capnocytophaga canimorsus]ATA94666.1 hypothetical protein CGC54_10150 [Capnocytophaga canimorsus]